MRAILVGNFGVGNLGDEALKEYFLQTFPDIEWSVISACPTRKQYARLPFGLRSLFRPKWILTLGAIFRSQCVVFGGGSLFTDTESVFACLLWWWHAFVCRLMRKPILLAFQGVGPFRTKLGEVLARSVISRAAFVSVRDEPSARRIRLWKLQREIVTSFDPVFSLLSSMKEMYIGGRTLVAIPRANSGKEFRARLQEILEQDQIEHIMVCSLQPDSERETKFCALLQEDISRPSDTVPVRTLTELVTDMAEASAVLSQRYHGALAAMALGIPVEIICQADEDKLSELKKIQQSGISSEDLVGKVDAGERGLRRALAEVQ